MSDDVQRVAATFLDSIRSYRGRWDDEALAHDLAAVAVTLARGLVEQARSEQREAVARALDERADAELVLRDDLRRREKNISMREHDGGARALRSAAKALRIGGIE